MKHGPFRAASNAMANECEKCGQLFGLFSLSAGPPSIEGCEGVREGEPYPPSSDVIELAEMKRCGMRTDAVLGLLGDMELRGECMRRFPTGFGVVHEATLRQHAEMVKEVAYLNAKLDECGGNVATRHEDRAGSQLRHCVVCAKAQPVDDFNMMIDRMKSVGEYGDAEDSYVCDEHAPAVSKALVDMHLRWLESGDRSNDVDPIDCLADDA